MKSNIKPVLVAFVVVAVGFAPAFAFAQSTTVSQLQQEVQALLAQIAALKAQEHGSSTMQMPMMPASGSSQGDRGMGGEGQFEGPIMLNGSTTMPMPVSMPCFSFSRNLSMGSQGQDVSELQSMLGGKVTGYFGQMTQQALVKFQQEHGITSSTTGFLGPITRKFFGNHCMGMGDGNNSSSVGMPPVPMMPMTSGTPIGGRPSGTYSQGSSTAPWGPGPAVRPSGTMPMLPPMMGGNHNY